MMETAHTTISDGYKRVAPEGWAFVTNDPDVLRAPDRTVSLIHQKKRLVILVDTRIRTFIIRTVTTDIRDVHGSYVPDDIDAPWRVGNTPFTSLGDLGAVVLAALQRHGESK